MNRRFSRAVAFLCLISVLMTGCAGSREDDKNAGKEALEYDKGIVVSNNVTPDEGSVLTSAAGYEKSGSKKALVQGINGAAEYAVINVNTDKAVLKGKIKYKKGESDEKEAVGVCDFSSVEKTGSYYVRVDTGRVSDVFTIEEDLYKKMLSDRLSNLGETEQIPDYSGEDMGRGCLRITDYLLSQEFFPDSVSPSVDDDARVIPRTMLLAKAETDVLRDYLRDDGTFKAPFDADAGSQYMYSAVFALFAYEYMKYDAKYAKECSDIAKKACSIAEEKYSESAVSEQKALDDKRYWAVAQLYKLTGMAEYREAAESYASDTPTGWNEEEFGYLGTMAYLTCYNRVDLDVCGQLVKELMDDINDVVRESLKDDYLVADGIDIDPAAGKVFENARLAVLGNFISKNIKYVECGENYLAYLYGRNMLGKDYAYAQEADYYDRPQLFILAGLIDSYIYEDKKPEAMER